MVGLLKKKRNGKELNREDYEYFVNGFLTGDIPDYQVSAFLMAVYFQGMTIKETAIFTDVMMRSGDVIDLSEIEGVKVDKHSTGGVGDKTTLILGPLVAAAGAKVAKMSGRGLGHTGGTLDKMEAIPGLSVDMNKEQFLQQVRDIDIAICGQNDSLVPADKKLYGLRDVTATVNNLALISSSIMSKKFACGADAIVIDIKVGAGAYMKTTEDAEELADLMMDISKDMGREVVVVISGMHEPLGNMIGNSLEIKEVIETLKGNGPEDLNKLVVSLGSHMLVLSKVVTDISEGARLLKQLLSDGSGLEKFRELIRAQGGDPSVIENPDLLPKATYSKEYHSSASGFISSLDALKVGLACVKLGAGRETKSSQIDFGAGIELKYKIGDNVKKGDVIAIMYSSEENLFENAEQLLNDALSISDTKPHVSPLIIKEIVHQ